MKTIKVKFGTTSKQYTFNTELDVKEGDVIKSPDYNADLTVSKIYDKLYQFGDFSGEVYEEKQSQNNFKIKILNGTIN